MTKLTTERLEKKIKSCIEIENCEVMMPLSAAQELLAFRNAAKNPIAWVVGDEEIADFKNGREVCVMRDCDDEQLDYLPLYAAPVLPKQPESEIPFGDVEPIEVTDDMVYAFHNQLSDSALGSDEFTDIKHGLCAALMNIPRPAQPVSEPYKLEIDMDDADQFSITLLHEIIYGKELIWPEAKLLARFMLDVKQRASASPAQDDKSASTELPNHSNLSTNSPVIPDGWKLVPIEPTPKMLVAAMGMFTAEELAEAWGDMLAAAPAQESE